LAIAYGGQFVTTRVRGLARVSHRLQQGFGAATIVFAAATYLQTTRSSQRGFPSSIQTANSACKRRSP
jgi:hypothetical protein